MPDAFGGRERVSSGRTRVPLLSWRLRLVGVLLFGIPALIRSDWSRPQPSTTRPLSLAGHTSPVLALVFSPDGRRLGSCGLDHTVRLWDTTSWESGRPAVSDVLPHPAEVLALAFSPDGTFLATAGLGSLTIWSLDPPGGRMVEKTGETYHSLAFSPDGRTLALGGDDGSIRILDMPAARERAVLRGHSSMVHCVAFSPDGKGMVSGSDDGRVVLWEMNGGAGPRVLIEGSRKPIRALVFSPDGRTLGVAEPAGAADALLFDVETAAIRTRLPGRPLGIVSLAFSPDGLTVATVGIDRTMRLWDPARSKELARLVDGRPLRSVAFSPDGRWLARAGGDGDVRLLDMRRPWAASAGMTVFPGSIPATGDGVIRPAMAGRPPAR